jgi:hypothetical protein
MSEIKPNSKKKNIITIACKSQLYFKRLPVLLNLIEALCY